jgi:hypothetical protein
VISTFKVGIGTGEIRFEVAPIKAAVLIISLLEGALTVSRLERDSEALRPFSHTCKAILGRSAESGRVSAPERSKRAVRLTLSAVAFQPNDGAIEVVAMCQSKLGACLLPVSCMVAAECQSGKGKPGRTIEFRRTRDEVHVPSAINSQPFCSGIILRRPWNVPATSGEAFVRNRQLPIVKVSL